MERYTIVKVAMVVVVAILALALLAGVGAFNNRPPYATKHFDLKYDDNRIATQTLSSGEGAGSIVVIAIVPYDSVIVSWANPRPTDVIYQTAVLSKGQYIENCLGKVELKETNLNSAVFEFTEGNYGCPICWYQGILVRMPMSESDPVVVRQSEN